MGRRLLAALLSVAVVAGLGVGFFSAAKDTFARTRADACRALEPDPIPPLLRDREAPDFELADATGKKWRLSALRGRPVLVNFWATWCPPCVDEMPSMEQLVRRLGERAVVLSVSVDENWDLVKRFFAAGTSLSVLLDAAKTAPPLYGTEKYPETFLVDASGRVKYAFINKRDWARPEAVACIESAQ